MKNNMRFLSILSFVISIPALIITDWYYEGFGLLPMFAFFTSGLVLDQLIRLKYPPRTMKPIGNYHINRYLNMIALVVFVWAPIGLIYGNRIKSKLGFWIMMIMVCCGIAANQFAKIKYPYTCEGGNSQ